VRTLGAANVPHGSVAAHFDGQCQVPHAALGGLAFEGPSQDVCRLREVLRGGVGEAPRPQRGGVDLGLLGSGRADGQQGQQGEDDAHGGRLGVLGLVRGAGSANAALAFLLAARPEVERGRPGRAAAGSRAASAQDVATMVQRAIKTRPYNRRTQIKLQYCND